jgi:hypothetical protein
MWWARASGNETGATQIATSWNTGGLYFGSVFTPVAPTTGVVGVASAGNGGSPSTANRRSANFDFTNTPDGGDGEWHHMAYTMQGLNCTNCYVDGIPAVFSGTSGGAATYAPNGGASKRWKTNSFWDDVNRQAWGDICDMRSYSATLSQADITSIVEGRS